jgi:hypothetical protein
MIQNVQPLRRSLGCVTRCICQQLCVDSTGLCVVRQALVQVERRLP